MKIVPNNLPKYIKKSGLSIAELVRRMNTIQNIVDPDKRPITRTAIYFYLKGNAPTVNKIYILSALLKVQPKKLFTLSVDEQKYQECLELAKKIKKEILL